MAELFGNSNTTKIRDKIITMIELSKRSKKPVLFFSNPGYGKTTTINTYAEKFGYHVESLIGSQYSQDEILGFMANTGKPHLEVLEPEWYTRIMNAKANGQSSILFLDELSTVGGPVQGALLQLCFERCIRGGKYLPEDTIVLAAANYKGNLPSYFEILAPQLNRFIICNILPSSPFEVITEFSSGVTTENWPTFANTKLSEKESSDLSEMVRSGLISLFSSYSTRSSAGKLDITNTNFNGIYDRPENAPEVLNFFSGRSESYLISGIKIFAEMGIKSSNENFTSMLKGLIGLGTNSWTDDSEDAYISQLNLYHKKITEIFGSVLNKFSKVVEENKEESKLDIYGDTLIGNVQKFISSVDTNDGTSDVYEGELLVDIYEKSLKYEHCNDVIQTFNDKTNVIQFKSDYEAMKMIADFLKSKSKVGSTTAQAASVLYGNAIQSIISNIKYYYEMAIANVNKEDVE